MWVLMTATAGSWVWWRWVVTPYTGPADEELGLSAVEAQEPSSPADKRAVAAATPAPITAPTPPSTRGTQRSAHPGDVSPEYDAAFPEPTLSPVEQRQLDVVTEQVVLGEQAFVEGDLEAAFDHFSTVVENEPDHPKAPFALYRLAWVEHKMGEHDHALEDMTEAVEWASVQNDGSQASRWLLQQVERDLETLQIEVDAASAPDAP